jgi:hypothetical protein
MTSDRIAAPAPTSAGEPAARAGAAAPAEPCCGTARAAAEAGTCCDPAAKAEAVNAGASCC